MDRGDWLTTVHGAAELDMTELLSLIYIYIYNLFILKED